MCLSHRLRYASSSPPAPPRLRPPPDLRRPISRSRDAPLGDPAESFIIPYFSYVTSSNEAGDFSQEVVRGTLWMMVRYVYSIKTRRNESWVRVAKGAQ